MADETMNEAPAAPAEKPAKEPKAPKAPAAPRAKKVAAAGDGAAAYGIYREALGAEDILGEMPGFEGLDAAHQAAWNAVAAGGGQ